MSENIFTGEAGAGLVKVVVNSKGYIESVEIDDSIFKSEDKQFVSDLFSAATNDAFKKLDEFIKDNALINKKYLGEFKHEQNSETVFEMGWW